MELTSIGCRGYKAFDRPSHIGLGKLSVIFGKNNSGKTTLARLPIFAAASLVNRGRLYSLDSKQIHFGTSFADLASVDQAHPRVSFEISWDPHRRLGAELQYVSSRSEPGSIQPLTLQIDNDSIDRFSLEKSAQGSTQSTIESALTREEVSRLESRRFELRRLLEETIHIPSSRPRIEGIYEVRPSHDWNASETPYILNSDPILARSVGEWYSRALDGTTIGIDRAGFAFRLIERDKRLSVNMSQSGRGIQAALPVVTLMLAVASQRCKPDLVIIEEPEAHLHPSAHGSVADLVIDCSRHAQVIIETHSENFILRLRRRIAERVLDLSDLSLFYIDEEHRISQIPLDAYGATTAWPSGVFESDIEEAEAIVAAKMAAIDHLH
jgi:predicted ATPase